MAIQPQDREPRLWVACLCLYSGIEPVTPIRKIPLRRGVNIIWAHEPENAQSEPSVRATGHGVGKTSFCLLLRYCLGDKSQSIRELCDEAATEFPKGGVGAIVHLEGRVYSVFRYFSHQHGFAAEITDLDSLFSLEDRMPYRDFVTLLSERMMSHFEPDSIPETGQKLEWLHLLAWLTRDQGTRFANFFHWRQGEGAGLQRARQDPPILMRVAMGLMEKGESRLLREIDTLEKRIVDAGNRIVELEREPALVLRRVESELRTWLKVSAEIPLISDDLLEESVDSLLKERLHQMAGTISDWESRLQDEEERLVWVQKQLEEEARNKEIADLDFQRQEALYAGDEKRLKEIAKKRSHLMQLAGDCEHGNVPFKDCSHIKQRLAAHDLWDARDEVNLKQGLSLRSEQFSIAQENLEQAKVAESSARKHYEDSRRECQRIRMELDTVRLEKQRGETLWAELERWQNHNLGEDKELATVRIQREDLTRERDSLKTKLTLIQQTQTRKEKYLSGLTQDFAQQLLSDEVFARFVSRDEARPFQLSKKGGEAYRVLEILLGDAVCMQTAATTDEALPPFFLHDCPREADMSIHLYSNYLLHLADMEQRLSTKMGEAPFQYIVTTTSPPPEALCKSPFLVLELKPEAEDSVLFRKQFGSVQEDWLR